MFRRHRRVKLIVVIASPKTVKRLREQRRRRDRQIVGPFEKPVGTSLSFIWVMPPWIDSLSDDERRRVAEWLASDVLVRTPPKLYDHVVKLLRRHGLILDAAAT